MRKRILFPLLALLIILISGGILYTLKPNPTENPTPPTQSMTQKMQQQYETYHTKIDTYLSENVIPISDEKTELDILYDKMFEAEDYLKAHAPHLLPPEEPIEEPINEEKLREEFYRILGPEATARLKAKHKQRDLEHEARLKALDDQIAAWDQELIDLRLEMKADEKRRTEERAKYEEKQRERRQTIERVNAFIERMKNDLVFENGKPIGFKSQIGNSTPLGDNIPPEVDSPGAAATDTSRSLFSSEIKEFSEPTPSEVVERQTPFSFDSAKSYRNARHALDQLHIQDKYFDVILSQYMTPKELDTYFPTEADQQLLKTRKAEMQKAVISEMRKVISKLPDAPAAEKRTFIRNFVMDNFEKSFANSVLKALEAETD